MMLELDEWNMHIPPHLFLHALGPASCYREIGKNKVQIKHSHKIKDKILNLV